MCCGGTWRLFLERARDRSPELVPDEDTEAAILDICAKVDQLPLGIELAAARVSVMSPSEIGASLEDHVGDLARRRSTPAHHRSVRAAVEWSYALLNPVEQAAFRSLAVFVGGFDADAAHAVAPMSLDMLARLVDKSLITVVPAGPGRTRYRLLDTMRAYASEQLAAGGRRAEPTPAVLLDDWHSCRERVHVGAGGLVVGGVVGRLRQRTRRARVGGGLRRMRGHAPARRDEGSLLHSGSGRREPVSGVDLAAVP
jgi:hypothetical protein